MGFAQLPFGQPALVDLAGQFGIQFPRLAADVLQALDQQGVVRSLLQAQGNQAVDLPGDHAEGEQHDQPQQPPALLNRQLADEQQQTGGQQARQGKTQERPQRYPAGDTTGDDNRAQHAVEQGLRQKTFRRHQGDNRIAEDQCRQHIAQQQALEPERTCLGSRVGAGECGALLQAQHRQRQGTDRPDTQFEPPVLAPEQRRQQQAGQQHQQQRQLQATEQQPRPLGTLVGILIPARLEFIVDRKRFMAGLSGMGHRGFRCAGGPGDSSQVLSKTSRNAADSTNRPR